MRTETVQDSSERVPEGFRRPPNSQESPKSSNCGSKTPKMVRRQPPKPPKTAQEASKRTPKRVPRSKNSNIPFGKRTFLYYSHFGLSQRPRRSQRLPRSRQDGQRGFQESPKTAKVEFRSALEAPQTAQEGPRTAPRRSSDGYPTVISSIPPPREPQEAPRRLPKASRMPQEAPHKLPRSPKRPPRGSQEAPKGFLDAPLTAQEGPKTAQEAPDGPRGIQDGSQKMPGRWIRTNFSSTRPQEAPRRP